MDDLDLDKLQIDVSLLQRTYGIFTQINEREMASHPLSTDPMVFDLGISTLTLTYDLFDRLVNRCIIRLTNDPSANALNGNDEELRRLGLLEAKAKDIGVNYLMSNTTTAVATYDVSVTPTGRVILKLAGVMAIIESFIRQGLFSALEALLSLVGSEVLPELLAHRSPRVRSLASERLL